MVPLITTSPYKKGHQKESFTNVSGGGLMVERTESESRAKNVL